MAKCLYRINIDGYFEEFSSEQELNDFLRTNKRTLVTSLLSGKMVFSLDKSHQQKVVDIAEGMASNLYLDKVQHRYYVGEEGASTELKSVTKYISEVRVKGKGGFGEYKLVKEFKLDQVVKLKKQELLATLNPDNTPKYTEEQADIIIQELKNKWEIQALVGTSWHEVAQKFFEGTITSPAEIVANFPEMENVTPRVLRKYIETLTHLKKRITDAHGEDVIFMPETAIYDKAAGIAGTIDLLVIDGKGQAHIYDYKTSTKSDADWSDAKIQGIKYQLGIYRQILRRAGVNVKGMQYLPVELYDVDYDEKVVYDFMATTPIPLHISDGEVEGINISTLLPYTTLTALEDVSSNNNVHEFLEKAFNYQQKNIKKGSKSVDETYEALLKTNSQDNKHYVLWNAFNTKAHTYIPKGTSEAEIKNIITTYLSNLDKYNDKLPVELHDFVRYAKTAKATGNIVEMEGRWNGNPDTLQKLKLLLSKYIDDSAWHPLESDTMYDLGIVAFEHEFTHEIDFVSLTANKLTDPLQLLRGKTLLGNVMKDHDALTKGAANNLTVGDVELLKIYALVKNNKDVFGEKKIGKMIAVNMQNNKVIPHIATQTFETLEEQWTLLMQNLPDFKLKGLDWDLKRVDSYESLLAYISDLFHEPTFMITGKEQVKAIASKFEKATDIDEKITILGQLHNKITDAVNNDLNVIKHDRRDLARLLTLISESILQLSGIALTVEDDMRNWGDFIGENVNLSTPERVKNVLARATINLVRKGLNEAGHAFNESAEDFRKMHADFYEGVGASAAKIKTIGYNQDLFERLMEPAGADGKRTFRFRNTETDTKLTKAEKEYINKYLEVVNEIRLKKIEAMPEYLQTDALARFNATERWNIPLMKTSMFSAFLGKNTKEFFNDYFRDMMNPNNIYKNDEESKRRSKFQKEMFNQFDYVDLNYDTRDDKIMTSDSTQFETDLEAVLAMYIMADAKETEFNKVMPQINAIKTMAMLSDYNWFTENDNTIKMIDDYVGTTLFGKTLVAGESVKAATVVKTLVDITSMAMLGFAPLSGFTEFLTGQWATFTKTIANKQFDWMFQASDLAKATPLVYMDTAVTAKMSIENISFCENINEMFQVSEMDINQIIKEVQATNTGIKNFKSKYMYWLNALPNYIHRMVFFNAQLIKDGALKVNLGKISADSALKMINGKLVYNEKLDERFKIYLANKEMPEGKQTSVWKEQRAMYQTLHDQLSQETGGLKADGSLARPYDNRLRDSMKSISDQVFGNYDQDSKAHFGKTAFGQIFMQFKNWATAKKHRYYSPTDIKGRQGRYVIENVDGEAKAIWKGKVMEGVYQSFMSMASDFKENEYNFIKTWNELGPSEKENFLWALNDLIGFALLSLIATLLYGVVDDPFTKKMVNSLNNSSRDLFIGTTAGAFAGTRNPIAIFGWSANVLNDTWGTITGDPKSTAHLPENIGLWRTISPIFKGEE